MKRATSTCVCLCVAARHSTATHENTMRGQQQLKHASLALHPHRGTRKLLAA
jgi:hypothetical protein